MAWNLAPLCVATRKIDRAKRSGPASGPDLLLPSDPLHCEPWPLRVNQLVVGNCTLGCPGDIDIDGDVDVDDLMAFIGAWGACTSE